MSSCLGPCLKCGKWNLGMSYRVEYGEPWHHDCLQNTTSCPSCGIRAWQTCQCGKVESKACSPNCIKDSNLGKFDHSGFRCTECQKQQEQHIYEERKRNECTTCQSQLEERTLNYWHNSTSGASGGKYIKHCSVCKQDIGTSYERNDFPETCR